MNETQEKLIKELDILPNDFKYTPIGDDKKPLLKKWNTNPLTKDGIRAYIINNKAMKGIGVVTGGEYMALDHDGNSCDSLIEEISGSSLNDALPKTVSFTSGLQGRRQFLYKIPEAYKGIIKNKVEKTGIKDKDGKDEQLDFRYENKCSVIAGKHPKTGEYKWIEHPQDTEIADAPQWVLDFMSSEVKELKPQIERQDKSGFSNDSNNSEIERAKDIIKNLDPDRADNYHDWLKVGMALHSVADSLLKDWKEWSKQSNKFKEGECEEKWESFKYKDNNITLGTLFYMAKEDSDNYDVADLSKLDNTGNFLDVKTIKQILDSLLDTKINWLIQDWFAQGFCYLISAPSGVGKSILAWYLALCISQGKDWFSYPISEPQKVIVFSMEETPSITVDRLIKLGIDENNENLLLLLKDKFWNIDQLSELEETIKKFEPKLLIIDSLKAIKGKYEENDPSIQRVVEGIRDLGIKYECTTVILHHDNKSGAVSGHHSIYSTVDGVIRLEKNKGCKFLVKPDKVRIGSKNMIECDISDDPENIGYTNPQILYPDGAGSDDIISSKEQKKTIKEEILYFFQIQYEIDPEKKFTIKEVSKHLSLNHGSVGTFVSDSQRIIDCGKNPDNKKESVYRFNPEYETIKDVEDAYITIGV